MRRINLVLMANFFVLLVLGLITSQFSIAEVLIPDNEFIGYFDYNGIYTVVGAVKNSEQYSVVPTVEIKIQDGNRIISESYTLPAVNPSKDIPFKIKFAQVSSKNPILEKPIVAFVPSADEAKDIQVVYDKTLVRHADGHTSGFIINNGSLPVYGVKIYALIRGEGSKLIDVGKSVENIEKIESGEKREFSIYPDPALASQVNYYSCFAIGDDMVIPMFVLREGKRFEFRYESGAYFNDVKFDDEKKSLALFARNPWPAAIFVNLEFPTESATQKFDVYLDGKQIYSVQSKDERGNWHVAFNLGPQTSSQILISGFESGQKPDAQRDIETYYLLGIIPAAAVIAGIFFQKKKKAAKR